MATRMTTAPISGQRVLTPRFMASVAYVPSPISRLIALKVIEALRPALRQRSDVTVMRIIAVVDMAEKSMGAVEPGASSDKHSADKPIGPVVAVRSAIIGGIVEVAVRAHWSRSDVDAYGDLGSRHRGSA